jgi:hypothetical protein
MPATRGFWSDPDEAAEVSAVLDDYADQLKEQARTRRERAEVARLYGYASELRAAHGLTQLAATEPVRQLRRDEAATG